MPQDPAPQTGDSGWGSTPPARRPEAAYEQTGAMAAQPYNEPPGRENPRPQQPRPDLRPPSQPVTPPHPGAPAHPGTPSPSEAPEPRRRAAGSRRRSEQAPARSHADQETMISESPPRRSRRSGGGPGGPTEPPGPPKGGDRPGWRRFIPSWKLVVASFVVLSAGVFGMIAVAYANTPVPREDQVQDGVFDQESIIYDVHKKELARLGTKRLPLEFEQIPRHVQDAVIAAENSSFREDSGISFSGMVRSLWSTVSGQQVQGASTITQQMARGYYDGLSKEVTIQRKVKEIFVAVKLNKVLTKDTILKQYLNTIYFGRGAYGIGAAADAFFNKKVGQLTPEEAAYLAGRIQNPSAFDSAEKSGNLAPTEERYVYALGQMAKLDPKAYGHLPAKSPKSPKRIKDKPKQIFAGLKGYMVQTVLNELESTLKIDREEVEKGGYRIYTSLDPKLMRAARDAVRQHTKGLPEEISTTMAAVDPRNGRIIAFYGGDDYTKDAWNDAFLSQKQAASAFKPYVLAAWLDAGYSLRSYVPTKGPVKLPGTTPIDNDHGFKTSAVDVVTATASSVNTAYAKMGEKVGLDKVIEIASKAGLSKQRLEDAESRHHYLITIGSGQVTAVEQAGGYSIFANAGKHYDNHVIIQVKDRNKQTIWNEKKSFAQVITPEAAADATAALQAVVKSGTGGNAALYDRPVAGKTGTNNDNKEAWFVGFTPQVSTAVGLFRQECRTKTGKVVQPVNDNCPWFRGKNPDREKKYTPQKPYSTAFEVPLGAAFQGATYPAAIWKTFMTEAMKGKEVIQFPARVDAGISEDLVPKPEPTPTPSDTPDPDAEFPGEDCGFDSPCDEDSDVSNETTENPFPEDEEDGGFLGDSGGDGGGGGAAVPGPTPGNRQFPW
ncbi:transglycosylase domain-containing protein [Nonomuraea sp. ATR24]|uniref:transglycosylase domain-containing protein n=1 Tax=unclassified Nonomuraea TaxID=2593643 RepID=UPI0033F558FF